MRQLMSCAVVLLMLAACSKPEPPSKDQPPAPQAQQHRELSDAIQRPLNKAKSVEGTMQADADAAAKQADAAEQQ